MKSKLFKQNQKEDDPMDQDEFDDDIEVDASGPEVANAKGGQMAVIIASALLVTIVVYFLFLKDDGSSDLENNKEIIENESLVNSKIPALPTAPSVETDDFLDSLVSASDEEDENILERPKLPEIPELPKLPEHISFNETVLPAFLDVPHKKSQESKNVIPEYKLDKGDLKDSPSAIAEEKKKEEPMDPRRSPIIVESSGLSSVNMDNRDNFGGGIIPLNDDPIEALKASADTIMPTVVKDRSSTIIQGKMMNAVLETAINTEMPGSIRGIISRDVYAESGDKVLIPKGSRLYGNYSTEIVRGQGRVQINWTRLIRTDGVDLQVGFVAADQFGRSGIEGELDNKYGSIIANSALTSMLAIGGAIAAEQLSGNDSSTTTVDPANGTSTSTGSPSSQVIADIGKTLVDTVSQVASNAIDVRPIIRIPQGTKMTIIVNADMIIPPLRK